MMIFTFWRLAYVVLLWVCCFVSDDVQNLKLVVSLLMMRDLKLFCFFFFTSEPLPLLCYVDDDHLWNYFIWIFVDGMVMRLFCLMMNKCSETCIILLLKLFLSPYWPWWFDDDESEIWNCCLLLMAWWSVGCFFVNDEGVSENILFEMFCYGW